MKFSQQEYWSGLPCTPPGYLPDPGTEPTSSAPPALRADSLPLRHWGSPGYTLMVVDSLRPHELSTPGSSVHGDSPGTDTRVRCQALF